MDKRFDDTASKGQLETVYNLLDACIKRLEAEEYERTFTDNQLNRHEGWIKQLAANTKSKLIPEP